MIVTGTSQTVAEWADAYLAETGYKPCTRKCPGTYSCDECLDRKNGKIIKPGDNGDIVLMRNNNTGFRGVSSDPHNDGEYRARVSYKGVCLLDKKGFTSAKDAAVFRDLFCVKNNIPLPLNFPQ